MRTTNHDNAQGRTEYGKRLRPLSIKQRRAIELLLKGLSDSEVAAQLGIRRETVNRWKNHHPDFQAAFADEQERLLLLGRAQREIEAAKRHAPPTTPLPLDDKRIEDDLRRSPALRAALRKQALLWVNYENAEPLTQEEKALLLANPQHVAYALRQMEALWSRTNAAGELIGRMFFYIMLDMNEVGQCCEYVPFWLNQPRQLSEEEQQELKELDMRQAVETMRDLLAQGMSRELAIRDCVTIYEVPRAELEQRLAASLEASPEITPKNCPENMGGSE